ncbi:putative CAAX amino terminal protease [endosymbiont of Riftia pachyptila (vent Ph05)]|jgi:membrane protease YdiL (CAAX protease family)|nr:putative CAAX amino terminal protease [endosymbiont of Riftia pachyptila (vent Ph05)]
MPECRWRQRMQVDATRSDRFDWQPAIALSTAAFCLLLIHYLKFDHVFVAALQQLRGSGEAGQRLAAALITSPFLPLFKQLWWGFWHLLGYLLIPLAVIHWLFREPANEYGLQLAETRRFWLWYLALATPILLFAWFASARPDFLAHYPFYRQASRSIFDLLAWEIIYLLQFFFLEFFFRGFLLHACQRAFGLNALFVMMLPYLMIHFAKPWLEASGAIFFGLLLGLLALRSRSIWGGVAVHSSIALGMDLMALYRSGTLPQRWWPG